MRNLQLLLLICTGTIFCRIGFRLGQITNAVEEADLNAPLINIPQRLRISSDRTARRADIVTPKCAKAVYIMLHRREDDNYEDTTCEGLLIRDDIILTSRKCSRQEFTFVFEESGVDQIDAIPHTALNERLDGKYSSRSQLGFLKAGLPQHDIFEHIHIWRTRMFLSERYSPHPHDREMSFMSCGARNQPIAYAFPIDNELVPLGQLKSILPSDILWETDLSTSRLLVNKSHYWWMRPITLKQEKATFKSMFKDWRGPPGSLSLPDAHNTTFVEQVSALCEAVDPRGHRYWHNYCFRNYFERYQKKERFSGLHFFDWLDYGPGTWLLEENAKRKMLIPMKGDENCLKREFNDPKKKMIFFNDEERLDYKIKIEPTKSGSRMIARYEHNGESVRMSERDDPHVYVWDLESSFYIVDDKWEEDRYGVEEIKHTSVVAGGPVLCAGEIYIGENGVIEAINFASGHYYPDIHSLSMLYLWMKNQGIGVTAFAWIGLEEWFLYGGNKDASIATRHKECNKYDWESVKVPGFIASQLKKACHEVTSSPMFELSDFDGNWL